MIVVAAVGDCGSGAVGPDPAAGAGVCSFSVAVLVLVINSIYWWSK